MLGVVDLVEQRLLRRVDVHARGEEVVRFCRHPFSPLFSPDLLYGNDQGRRGTLRVRVRPDDHRAGHHRHAARLRRSRRLRRGARQRRLAAARARSPPTERVLEAAAQAGHAGHPHPRGPSPRPVRPARRPRRRAASSRPASAIPARWAASWCAASTATTSSTSSTRSRASRWSTSRARAPSTPPTSTPSCSSRGITPARGLRRHHRGLRQHHGARGQRPRLRLPGAGGLRRLVLPGVPARSALEMIKAQGGIFGWVSALRARFLDAPGQPSAIDTSDSGAIDGERDEPPSSPRPAGGSPATGTASSASSPTSLLNVIVLTGLCLGVVQAARRHRVRPHPAGARHRAAARQPLLRLPRLAARARRRAAATSPRCRTARACRTCSSSCS